MPFASVPQFAIRNPQSEILSTSALPPSSQLGFKVLQWGEPFLFKLKGRRVIGGGGFFTKTPLEFDGVVKYPDFTIEDDDAGITYYWEHCGLLHDAAYSRRWKNKQQWYQANQILPLEEGGGSNGTLVITRDQVDGGIDSKSIGGLISNIFGS